MTASTTILTHLVVHRRARSEPVVPLAQRAGLPPSEITRLVEGGLRAVPVMMGDLAGAVGDVFDELDSRGWDAQECAGVVFTHSLPLGLPEMAAIEAAIAPRVPPIAQAPLFVSGRPCSVGHLGVEIARRHRTPGSWVVLGGDIATDAGERFFFGSAMGDAVVGLVLSAGRAAGHRVLACRTDGHILAWQGAASPPDVIERYRAMAPSAVRSILRSTLADAGLSVGDLTAIVPHTPYRQMWDVMAPICRVPRELIMDDYLADTGHLNGNDVFVHLERAIREGRLVPGDVAALLSPGFGGTRGCTVIEVGER